MTEKRKQDERLQIRCTAEEKEVLQVAADAENRTLSNYVLTVAVTEARKLLNKKG